MCIFARPRKKPNYIHVKFCGKENVNHRHICAQKLEQIQFYCGNCGAIAVDRDHVCNPLPIEEIDPAVKAVWEKSKKQTKGKKMLSCATCGQPVEAPGHYCDRKVPYICQYCGAKIDSNYHICQAMMGKFKYICKTCGRLGIKANDICAPRDL